MNDTAAQGGGRSPERDASAQERFGLVFRSLVQNANRLFVTAPAEIVISEEQAWTIAVLAQLNAGLAFEDLAELVRSLEVWWTETTALELRAYDRRIDFHEKADSALVERAWSLLREDDTVRKLVASTKPSIESLTIRFDRFGLVFRSLVQNANRLFVTDTGVLARALRTIRFRQQDDAAPAEIVISEEQAWTIAVLAQLNAGLAFEDLAELVRSLEVWWTETTALELRAYDRRIDFHEKADSALVERAWSLLREDDTVRKLVASTKPSIESLTIRFDALVRMESAWLGGAGKRQSLIHGPATTREPWVFQPDRDYFGLALSGGGIRSASFNLGVLQAFARTGLLQHVDYLSTVSGGGYIGGFWSAWRRHTRERQADHSPREEELATTVFPGLDSPTDAREHPTFRHLREFSRFLMPRVGFAQLETWNGVVVVLGGTLVSVFAVSVAIALVFLVWYLLTWCVLSDARSGAAALAFFTLAYHLIGEYRLARSGRLSQPVGTDGKPEKSRPWGDWVAISTSLLAFTAWVVAFSEWDACKTFTMGMVDRARTGDLLSCWRLALDPSAVNLRVSPIDPSTDYLTPAWLWIQVAVVLMVVKGLWARFVEQPRHSGAVAAIERAAGRCLALALVVLGLGLAWKAAGLLALAKGWWAAVVPAAGGGATVIFVLLRDWLKEPIEETRGSRLASGALKLLGPKIPQIAANVAVAILFVGVAFAVQALTASHGQWRLLIVASVVCVAVLFFFDPAVVGLHDFYRARIARCFLGAAREQDGDLDRWTAARPPVATDEQPKDDVTLGDLRRTNGAARPIHLVCCAANNLSGDVLGSLYRGARSAVLSPFGVSVGAYASPRDDLRLSSALTASAAAVNSHMGSLSTRLGPAVAFLLATLNLRLGLWVPHPLNPTRRRRWSFPGWYFYVEALGMSRSDQAWGPKFTAKDRVSVIDRYTSKLHLSDGGHFENLGLYELVRRHCRYIVVSDATADPALAFEDLANAIRRIREDFGVEIDLDVTPLYRTASGRATQHAVMGMIHYDGLEGTDKGMLLYLKPTLTGDEPIDVLEHQVRSPTFPHDGTGDQFYDEAQWESYRRLGQHAASSVLNVPYKKVDPARFVDNLFMRLNDRWYPGRADQEAVFLRLTERCAALESEIRDKAPERLKMEFFPEVAAAFRYRLPPEDAAQANASLYFLMLVGQLMEDVWLAADLDNQWSHPLNDGWMNYFSRWASTPTFRTWWPVLRSLYSPRFRDFVKDRFDIRLGEAARGETGPRAWLELKDAASVAAGGMAFTLFSQRADEKLEETQLALVYELKLHDKKDDTHLPIQVGCLLYELRREPDAGSHGLPIETILWESSRLFVPPALIGAGIISRFLDAIVAHFEKDLLSPSTDSPASRRLRVSLGKEGGRPRDPAHRRSIVQTVGFYKSRGFDYGVGTNGGSTEYLELVLPRRSISRRSEAAE